MRVYTNETVTVFPVSPAAIASPTVTYNTLLGLDFGPIGLPSNLGYEVTIIPRQLLPVRQDRPLRTASVLYNMSETVTVFLGGEASLSASNGMPLLPQDYCIIGENYNGAVYGVTLAGTAFVRVWEVRWE